MADPVVKEGAPPARVDARADGLAPDPVQEVAPEPGSAPPAVPEPVTAPPVDIVMPPPAPPSPGTGLAARQPVAALTVLAWAFGLLALIGWSLGTLAGVGLIKGSVDRLLSNNIIAPPARHFLLMIMVLGAAIVCGAGAVAYLLMRRRGRADAANRLYRSATRLSLLALAGFLPFIFQWKAWMGREMTFLVFIAMFSLSAWAAARGSLSSPPLLGGRGSPLGDRLARSALVRRARDLLAGRLWPWLPLALVVAGGIGYTALFASSTITFHRNLYTQAYDLGLEDNLVYNILHRHGFFRSTPWSGPTGSHFGNHATFFSYLIAPFYALAPGAETLLFIQSFLIGMAAVPLFLFARRHVSAWMAFLIAAAYLLYPPAHGANLYEFHYIPLGAFFLWSALFLWESRRDRLAIVATIVALSVREDIGGAGVAIVGAYLLLTGKRPRAGLIVAAAGALHFTLLKLVFMPLVAGGGESFVTLYKDLFPAGQESFTGVLKTVFGNPFYTLGTLLERDKLFYILQFLVPLAFVPLRRPIILLLVIPGFFFTVLSTGYPPLIQASFQYTFYWVVFLFVGLVAVLERRPDEAASNACDAPLVVRRRALMLAVTCASIATSYQMGGVFQRHTVKGGFSTYNFETTPRNLQDRAALAKIIPLIPPLASVSASDPLVPHISARPVAYTLRFAVFDAEYLLFFSEPGRIEGGERAKITDALTRDGFGVVAIIPPFAIARRGHPQVMNDQVLIPWGTRMPTPAVPATPPPSAPSPP